MNKNISNSNSSPLPTGEGQGVRLEAIRSVYFVGAGGIGMSALIRYFLSKGKTVAGYDRTSSELTERLITEGAQIHYEEDINLIPEECKDKASTLVVYTPAVPQEHAELTYFRENGFDIHKRSQVLGIITRSSKGLCVAGTHGKTTTSTMAAHLLHQSHVGCIAFLGGISKNYGTNLLLSATSPYTVIEADEFDRSFHWLSPWMSVITATDPDHLDIYGTKEAYLESFRHDTTLIQPGGALILHKGLEMQADVQPGVATYTYSRNEGDFHAENIRIGNGEIFIDFVAPDTRINDIQLGVPVSINIENGVAAMALAHLSGATDEEIKQGMASFRGVDRRFDFKLKNDRIVFLSDYAHHPAEIAQSVKSVRELYQDKKITVIFQPHLYTRTRDFYRDFADSLSLSDEVILTEIYPAREQPIPGVTSQLIYDNLRPGIEKCICRKEDVLSLLTQKHTEVLVVLGAGDLDNYAPQITQLLSEKYHG
ncbi:cyanophycin synthetase [Bacteroides uniformis]